MAYWTYNGKILMNWKNGNEGSAAVDLKPRDPPGSIQINNCLHSTANSNYTGSTRRTAETATGSDRRRPDDRKGTSQNNIPSHSSKYSTRPENNGSECSSEDSNIQQRRRHTLANSTKAITGGGVAAGGGGGGGGGGRRGGGRGGCGGRLMQLPDASDSYGEDYDDSSREESMEQLEKRLEMLEMKETNSHLIIDQLKAKLHDLQKENGNSSHGNNLKQYSKSAEIPTSADKSVQADWTMVLETRAESSNKLKATGSRTYAKQDLHSSAPNLVQRKRRTHVQVPNRLPSKNKACSSGSEEADSRNDSEEDEEEERISNSIRLREDNLMAHLKDYRQRTEDLHRLVSLRDANIDRLQVEMIRLRETLVEYKGKEKEMQSFISDLKLNLTDLEAQYDEDLTLCQLREAEHKQTIEELNQKILKLQAEKQKMITERQQQLQKQQFEEILALDNRTDQRHNHQRLSNSHHIPHQKQLHVTTDDDDDTLTSSASSSIPNSFQSSQRHEHRATGSNNSYQTTKPVNQRIFLNGQVILSNSSSLNSQYKSQINLPTFETHPEPSTSKGHRGAAAAAAPNVPNKELLLFRCKTDDVTTGVPNSGIDTRRSRSTNELYTPQESCTATSAEVRSKSKSPHRPLQGGNKTGKPPYDEVMDVVD